MKSHLRPRSGSADGVRAIVCLLLAVLLPGSGFVPARAADEIRIPSVALLADIQLTVDRGWFLTINADGAGWIRYGSGPLTFTSVPVGTFDFERVYSSLAQSVRSSGNMRESFTVVFGQRHATVATALYTDDADLVLGLFNTAKQNAVGLNGAGIQELWEQSPPSRDPIDLRRLIARIAEDIAGLKDAYPQLVEFSVAKHLQADSYAISYSHHTHEPSGRGGWTSGVPNPDEDGIWFHIDFHDRDSRAELHTQPMVVEPYCVGQHQVSFLSLEGARTRSVAAAIWDILRTHGATECDQ